MRSESMPMDSRLPVRLPADWREVPLRAVADTRFSNVDKLTKAGERPVRLCNYTDVYNNDYITQDIEFMEATAAQPEIDKFRLQVGDVIITKDSETPYDIGIPARVDYAADDLVCGYHLALLRPNQEVVDPDYLSKQLGHARLAGYFARMANGLTRYGLSIGAISEAPIWVPPLAEQQSIGHVFRQIDFAIQQTEARIVKLKQVRAGLLSDLLTRYLRFGKNAEGASLVPFMQLVDVNPPTRTRDLSSDTLVSFVPMSDVSDFGEWTHRQAKTLGSIGNGYTAFQEGDVLFAKITPCMENGKGMLAQGLANGIGLGSTEFHVLRPKQGINPKLIFHVLQAAIVRQKAIAFMSGSAGQQRVQAEYFGQLYLPLFSAEEQAEIIDSLDAMDDEIRAFADELVKLQAISTGLTDDLLTGRVRVPAELEMA